jgi:ElaA protein
MAIHWKLKTFEALSPNELYDFLRLRSDIFVVEQNCIFLEQDNKDQLSQHLMGYFEGKIVAYCRIFKSGVMYENASIGRVVVDARYRANKFGHDLMREAIAQIETVFGDKKITIGAQLYLQKFYEKHGFVQTSTVYLEDDIEHIEMKRE